MIQRRQMVNSAALSSECERSANGEVVKGRVSWRLLALARMLILACGLLALCGAEARAQSALDGFDPGTNGSVKALVVQSDGKIIVGGQFTMLGGGGTGITPRSNIGRLNADGSLDITFNPGADGAVLALTVQADGKILVGGFFSTLGGGSTGTTTRNNIGRLNPDGSLDTTFNPGANDTVHAFAVQPDGKILVGGFFSTLGGGGTGTTTRNFIGRLNSDGSLDTAFNPGADLTVFALAVQPDGKIIVGGAFGVLGNQVRSFIGRLNANGSLDTTFNPGANNTILALAVQADSKIVVGGAFTALGGGGTGTTTRNRIGRLNADGSLETTFNPGANSEVFALAVQPDGKIVVGGQFTMLGGGGTGTTTRNRIARLNADGSLETTFNPGANDAVYALTVEADGKFLVGGGFTMLGGGTGITLRRSIGRLNADGSLDTTFNPGANDRVLALAVQPDGKIVVGGYFTMLGGGNTGTSIRRKIGRLNPDGSLDMSFDPGADDVVRALAVQADGKIVVAGNFTMLGGGGAGATARNRIGRLNPDGTLDMSFNPGANDSITTLAVQSDGKILVAGNFTMLGGGSGTITRSRIGRLNADGTLDTSFNPGANGFISALAVQTDGKILMGGGFTMLGGGGTGTITRNHIGRLNADGTLDMSFDPGANSEVSVLVTQADGKILAGGGFSRLGGGGTGTTNRYFIGRLNADGSLDTGFNPGTNFGGVISLAVQADGKILVGGGFTMLGGVTGTTTRNRIGRLNTDGTLDASFDPGANSEVYALALQTDGKILVGGMLTMLGGGGTGITTRNFIGRLTNTRPAYQSLTVSPQGDAVRWFRSGSSPELSRVVFEYSADGLTYSTLGEGTRTNGGWARNGLMLPNNQNFYVRARGFYPTGALNGSASITNSIRQAVVTVVPLTTTVQFDSTAYNVFEYQNFVTVTVTRAGNLSNAVTVDYLATNGSANQTGDYIITSGTLKFAAGETAKTFNVIIIDDLYVEGDESINLSLSKPTNGAVLDFPASATLSIIDNDTTAANGNPVDDASFFVRQNYADFLTRVPDQGGLDYWSGQITQCGTNVSCVNFWRSAVSAAFFIEQEFQSTGSFVYRLHKAAYGSRPVYQQFMLDRARVVDSPDLEQNKQTFAELFVQRPEFVAKYGQSFTCPSYTDALITTVLGGSGVDLSARRSELINECNIYAGDTKAQRSRVLRKLIEYSEFMQAEYNRAFVLMQYFGYLKRDPDEGGYQFWLNVVNNNVPNDPSGYRSMVCAFITSPEYQQRFSPVVTRNDTVCAPQ